VTAPLRRQDLLRRGTAGTDADAAMLLNHKAAIEFLVDAVPLQGLSVALVCNLHAVLMQDLLADTEALGAIPMPSGWWSASASRFRPPSPSWA
jgi:hypothetical protein